MSLKRDKKTEYANAILTGVDLSKDWESIADNINIEYLNNISSNLNGSFNTIGKNNSLIKELQNLNEGETSSIISSRSNVFVVKLKNKESFSESNFNEVKDSLKKTMIIKNKNQIYNQWINSEKDRIDVKDLRSKIF